MSLAPSLQPTGTERVEALELPKKKEVVFMIYKFQVLNPNGLSEEKTLGVVIATDDVPGMTSAQIYKGLSLEEAIKANVAKFTRAGVDVEVVGFTSTYDALSNLTKIPNAQYLLLSPDELDKLNAALAIRKETKAQIDSSISS